LLRREGGVREVEGLQEWIDAEAADFGVESAAHVIGAHLFCGSSELADVEIARDEDDGVAQLFGVEALERNVRVEAVVGIFLVRFRRLLRSVNGGMLELGFSVSNGLFSGPGSVLLVC
jgi:hypothetical protein